MRREKWKQQHPLRISFCFLNSLPALPQPHPLIFPSQFAFISRSLPPCNHIPSTSSCNASLPQPLPQPLPPSHLPSLSSCLFFPFLLFPPSLFLCSSVPLSSLPFWAFGRSFRNHILKRILDITNPHRTLTVCGWTSACFFYIVFCSHGLLYCRHRRPFFAWDPCSHHAHWNAFSCSSLLAARHAVSTFVHFDIGCSSLVLCCPSSSSRDWACHPLLSRQAPSRVKW